MSEYAKIIVIDGLDASGKETLTNRLYDELTKTGHDVHKFSFPRYDCPSSYFLKKYLDRKYDKNMDEVNPYAAAMFYAMDRYDAFKDGEFGEAYKQGSLILCDRYTTSNMIHQCARLPREAWDDFLFKIQHLEHTKFGIPEPDLVYYLRMTPEATQTLLNKRNQENNSVSDILESDLEYRKKCFDVATYCAEVYKWTVIDCMDHDTIRSSDDIFCEVRDHTYKWLYD